MYTQNLYSCDTGYRVICEKALPIKGKKKTYLNSVEK